MIVGADDGLTVTWQPAMTPQGSPGRWGYGLMGYYTSTAQAERQQAGGRGVCAHAQTLTDEGSCHQTTGGDLAAAAPLAVLRSWCRAGGAASICILRGLLILHPSDPA